MSLHINKYLTPTNSNRFLIISWLNQVTSNCWWSINAISESNNLIWPSAIRLLHSFAYLRKLQKISLKHLKKCQSNEIKVSYRTKTQNSNQSEIPLSSSQIKWQSTYCFWYKPIGISKINDTMDDKPKRGQWLVNGMEAGKLR